MFNGVVIATDPDAGPNRATAIAVGLAGWGHLPVEVLSIVATHCDRLDAERRRPASAVAANARLSVIADDDVASAIVEHVQHRDGTLLVMAIGAVGLLSESRTSLGARVLTELRQPLLLVGPAVTQRVSLDRFTLVMATDRTQDVGAAVAVTESWQQTFASNNPWVVEVIARSGWPSGAIDDTGEPEHVDTVAGLLAGRGVDAATRVLHGHDPVACLVDFADSVDGAVFVVTSDRWAGGRSHWYSTTRRLVQRSPCPVLVVPSDFAIR